MLKKLVIIDHHVNVRKTQTPRKLEHGARLCGDRRDMAKLPAADGDVSQSPRLPDPKTPRPSRSLQNQ